MQSHDTGEIEQGLVAAIRKKLIDDLNLFSDEAPRERDLNMMGARNVSYMFRIAGYGFTSIYELLSGAHQHLLKSEERQHLQDLNERLSRLKVRVEGTLWGLDDEQIEHLMESHNSQDNRTLWMTRLDCETDQPEPTVWESRFRQCGQIVGEFTVKL